MTAELALWWVRGMATGGVVLLVGFLMVRWRSSPTTKLFIGNWAVRASLIGLVIATLPAWWSVTLSTPINSTTPTSVEIATSEPIPTPEVVPESSPPTAEPSDANTELVWVWPVPTAEPEPIPQPVVVPEREATVEVTTTPVVMATQDRIIPLLLALYAIGVGFGLIRLAFGQFALGRLSRQSRPASESMQRLFETVGGQGIRLRVSDRIGSPVCFGLVRPTVLMPTELAERGNTEELRWVFAHEINHLRHGDVWSRLWMEMARAAYFLLPWVWWLRGEVRLAQEQIADASAVEGSRRTAEYADFLVRLSCRRPREKPFPVAVGVQAGSSDLFRRVSMLLNENRNVNQQSPGRWSTISRRLTAGAFLSLAVLFGGVTLGARADEEPKPAPKDEEKQAERQRIEQQLKQADAELEKAKQLREQALEQLKRAMLQNEDEEVPNPFGGLPPEAARELNQMLRLLQELSKQLDDRDGAEGMPQFDFFFPQNGMNPFGMPFGQQQQVVRGGRLGIGIAAPSPVLIEQLELPEGKGMVVTSVTVGSAASKAGLKENDILLEFDGKSVPSEPSRFVEMVNDAKADEAMTVTVLRKGRKELIEGVTLPKAAKRRPANPNPFENFPGFPGLPANPFQFQGGFGGVFPGMPMPPAARALPDAGAGQQMSVRIRDGKFTADMQKGDVSIRMTGSTKDGTTVEEIVIQDGDAEVTANDIKDVPEKYREDVEAMLKQFTVVD